MFKVMTVVGTRPELIKLSMVIAELDKSTIHRLVHTGQNFDFELNEIFFRDLGIRKPDHFLECAGETPAQTVARVIERVDALLASEKPDAILIYGDTNSCLCALAAKRRQIPIFHMEAGNRCFDLRVPEEINRKIVDHLSDINMTLTEHARRYLLAEGLKPETVMCVGSSMPEVLSKYHDKIMHSEVLSTLGLKVGQYFVLSAHREENVDDERQLQNLVSTLKVLTKEFSIPIVFSTHPRTRKKLEEAGVGQVAGVQFLKPLGFFDYVALQKSAYCVLSDSGTITEEASILKFPAVTLRNAHERPEGMDAGVLVMSGLAPQRVVDSIRLIVGQHESGYRPGTVTDYMAEEVSKKVVRIIYSYVDYVRRTTWFKTSDC